MDPQERYDRFLSALAFRAGVADTPTAGVELTDLDGEPVEPAVHLHVCPRSLAEHVCDEQGLDPQARQALAFGDDAEPEDLDDPEAARLQTLLAQIEEAILVREPGHDHLVLVDGGVKAVRADDVAA
jgi:hypothetical protein